MAYPDFICAHTYALLRTCNNQEDLETTSNSLRVKVDLLKPRRRQAMQASQMIPLTMTCMLEFKGL